MKVTPQGSPFHTIPIAFPGQVAWVHSPCFSQELEAAAMNSASGKGDFASTSSSISETILKLAKSPFKNAEGKENDWAKRMMGDSVLMNPSNMAATLVGSGFPKMVVLTFWNDPSNPISGGVNYSYFIEVSYDILPKELRKDEGGGMIFMGPDIKGLDLGHFSKQVVEINEWMVKFLDFMKACQAGARPTAPTMPKNMPEAIKHLVEQAKKGYETVGKGQQVVKEYRDQENSKAAEKSYDNEHFVTIDGVKYEKERSYNFVTRNSKTGQEGHVTCTPGMFKTQHYPGGSMIISAEIIK